jgi:hypothetical protein
MLYWLLVIVPALDPFAQAFRRPPLVGVVVMEFPKLPQAAYEIPCSVPSRIRIVALLVHLVL